MRSAIPGNSWLPLVFLGLFCAFTWLRTRHTGSLRSRETGPPARVQREDRFTRTLRMGFSVTLAGLVTLYGFWHVFGWFRWMGRFQIPLPDPVRWAAAAAAAAALLMLMRIHRDLGDGFSVRLRVRADHDLVTDGLYAHVRHPMYAALSAFFLSASILSGHGLIALCGVALTVLLWSRTVGEERMMEEHFGDAYREYRARTGRFFPRPAFLIRRTRKH